MGDLNASMCNSTGNVPFQNESVNHQKSNQISNREKQKYPQALELGKNQDFVILLVGKVVVR